MKKSFCDKCGDEIKVDSEWVFGKELCPVCSGIIRDWLDGKTLELGCETEDKPIITDPECCGVCLGCKYGHTAYSVSVRTIIIECRHYHKRIVQSYDIPYESITPEAFKTRGEDIILDCHGYSEEG